MNEHQPMMIERRRRVMARNTIHAVDCSECHNIYPAFLSCEACEGIGRVIIQETVRRSYWPRVFAYVLIVGAVVFAFLYGWKR